MDVVLYAVFHHFGRRHRWQAALTFFDRLQAAWPPAAVSVLGMAHVRLSFHHQKVGEPVLCWFKRTLCSKLRCGRRGMVLC